MSPIATLSRFNKLMLKRYGDRAKAESISRADDYRSLNKRGASRTVRRGQLEKCATY
jgi:hypothetical protein